MIKWQVDGLQVVCLPVTRDTVTARQSTPQLACDVKFPACVEPFFASTGKGSEHQSRWSRRVGIVAVAFVAAAVLTRSECDAKGA